jgi:hypothetical protein
MVPRGLRNRSTGSRRSSTLRDVIRHYYPGVFHVARELFDELRQYSGSTAFRDVLVPWTAKRGQMIVELMAPLARYGDWHREEYRWADPLEQAYALSRVNDVLLLGFQPALPVGAELPWAHDLHLGIPWPNVTLDEYQTFWTDLAMTLVDEPDYDPFLHEIVTVEQAEGAGQKGRRDQTGDPAHAVQPTLIVGARLSGAASGSVAQQVEGFPSATVGPVEPRYQRIPPPPSISKADRREEWGCTGHEVRPIAAMAVVTAAATVAVRMTRTRVRWRRMASMGVLPSSADCSSTLAGGLRQMIACKSRRAAASSPRADNSFAADTTKPAAPRAVVRHVRRRSRPRPAGA